MAVTRVVDTEAEEVAVPARVVGAVAAIIMELLPVVLEEELDFRGGIGTGADAVITGKGDELLPPPRRKNRLLCVVPVVTTDAASPPCVECMVAGMEDAVVLC